MVDLFKEPSPVRVISKAKLRQFWQQPGNEDSEDSLKAWWNTVRNRDLTWNGWNDVRATYATASPIGRCLVFNIGGNKYRLVVRIHYESHVVYVLAVMTHKEYDDDKWKESCGCFATPPKRAQKAAGKKSSPRKSSARVTPKRKRRRRR